MAKEKIDVRFDKDFGCYVAVAPGPYPCVGFGASPREARERLEFGRALWLDADGNPRCGPECGVEHSEH